MPIIEVTQKEFQPISPTMGKYQIQYTWQLDSTTLLPVSVTQEVSYPAPTQPAYTPVP